MTGRAPGIQCDKSMPYLKTGHWDSIPFSPAGGGCGAAMRTSCIGLYFNKPNQLDDLISISIESGRMTHNHPTGFFGGVIAALFTSYAIQGIPVVEWGRKMIKEVIPKCITYLQDSKRDFEKYSDKDHLTYFTKMWNQYLENRKISKENENIPIFPSEYGIIDRDDFYKSISFSGWGGSSGHDSVIISYDALLGSGDNWKELLLRGALHGGDSDSTGSIAGSWFGALYGFKGVPKNHFDELEYLNRLQKLGKQIFELSLKQSKM